MRTSYWFSGIGVIIGLLLLTSTLSAQQKEIPLSVGYYGYGFIRPGGKIGAYFDLKEWSREKTKKDKSFTRMRTLYVNPQLGFYSRYNFYMGFVANVETGIRFQKEGGKWYSGVTGGLGYLLHAEVTSYTVNFKGEISNKQRELQHNFMTTLNYELGWQVAAKLDLYGRASYGAKFSSREAQQLAFGELGIKFRLGASSNQKQEETP